MPRQVIIRRYAPADEDAVIGVWSRSATRAHPFVHGEGFGRREAEMRDIYLVQADNWVAQTEAGEIVGLLGLLGAEIGGLFVDPQAQGHGIGRLLVEHAARVHGDLHLEVYERNERARRFYAHLGFEQSGSRIEEDTGLTLLRLVRSS